MYTKLVLYLSGLCVDLAIQITLINWMPTPDESYVLYVLAGMWGFTDGIWQTQINGNVDLLCIDSRKEWVVLHDNQLVSSSWWFWSWSLFPVSRPLLATCLADLQISFYNRRLTCIKTLLFFLRFLCESTPSYPQQTKHFVLFFFFCLFLFSF